MIFALPTDAPLSTLANAQYHPVMEPAPAHNQLHMAIDPERMQVSLRLTDGSIKIPGWIGRLL